MGRIARFLHISDVHLGAFSEDDVSSRVRRQDVADAFARALELAIAEQADFVVIAGDLFDRKVVSPDVLHSHARAALEKLRAASIPAYAIEGNHDEAAHGARHSWVTYLGAERLLIPLRPVLEHRGARPEQHPGARPEIAFPADETAERPAGRAVAPGGIPIVGLGYLGSRTDEVLEALPGLLPELGVGAPGRPSPAIVLLHAMRSPTRHSPQDGGAEPGTFTTAALAGLAERNVYLALGHGHRRVVSAGRDAPASFAYASPGSLEYIHETDFHLEDPRGALLVDVDDDGRFTVAARDTVKRPRCAVTVDLAGVAAPADLHAAVISRCAEVGVPPKAILGIRLAGEPPFSRSQLPVLALERRIREAFAPVSLDVRFDEGALEGGSGGETHREDDVTATLALALRERAGDVAPELLERVAAFVAPRVGDGGVWRSQATSRELDRRSASELDQRGASELDDALSLLLDLVAGPQAAGVRELLAELPHSQGGAPWSS